MVHARPRFVKGPPEAVKSGSDKTWESSTGQRSPIYTNPCTSRVCAAKPKVRRNCIRRNCTPHPHPKQTSDNSVYTPPLRTPNGHQTIRHDPPPPPGTRRFRTPPPPPVHQMHTPNRYPHVPTGSVMSMPGSYVCPSVAVQQESRCSESDPEPAYHTPSSAEPVSVLYHSRLHKETASPGLHIDPHRRNLVRHLSKTGGTPQPNFRRPCLRKMS